MGVKGCYGTLSLFKVILLTFLYIANSEGLPRLSYLYIGFLSNDRWDGLPMLLKNEQFFKRVQISTSYTEGFNSMK